MQSELELSRQDKAKFLAKKAKLKTKIAELKADNTKFLKWIVEEYVENEADIAKFKTGLQYPIIFEHIEATILELEARNAKIRLIIEEYLQRNQNLRKIANSRLNAFI